MAASDQYKQALIKQIAINTGIDASSLRTEVDNQNRQYSIKSMLSEQSPTTEHYDISASDKEEEARQDQIDIAEMNKDKSSTFLDKFKQEYQLLPDRSPVSD
eukprot:3077580-Heterocapsa_arctica.AAC.1